MSDVILRNTGKIQKLFYLTESAWMSMLKPSSYQIPNLQQEPYFIHLIFCKDRNKTQLHLCLKKMSSYFSPWKTWNPRARRHCEKVLPRGNGSQVPQCCFFLWSQCNLILTLLVYILDIVRLQKPRVAFKLV